MPDGSDWNVRGELGSLSDSMVASETGLQSNGSSVDGSIDSVESADWDHGFRDRPWHHRKKNCDLHGGQYGLKSCPVYWRHKKITNLEPAIQNQQVNVDNKLLDEYKEVDITAKERIVLVEEMDADKGVEKSDDTVGEITKTGNWSNRVKKKCATSLYDKQYSTKIEERSKKESLTKVQKGSTKADSSKIEKGLTKEDLKKVQKDISLEGSTNMEKNTTKEDSAKIEKDFTKEDLTKVPKGTKKESSLYMVSDLKNTDKGLDRRKHGKYEVNKDQSEKLAKWKVLETEEVEKNDEDIPETVKVPEILHVTKDSFNMSLKEMDSKKLQEDNQLSCYGDEEEEETVVKTALDCLSDDVEEKCDTSNKKYVSLGFWVTESELDSDQDQTDMEDSCKYSGRALEETSWCNSVDSLDRTDSGLTKFPSDVEIDCASSDDYEKDRSVQYGTWSERNMKSGVLLPHVDNRDLEEFRKIFGPWKRLADDSTLNWLANTMEAGHIDWRTADLKNHVRSFLTKQTGGYGFMDSEQLDLLIQFKIEKLLCSKSSCSLLSVDPQNLETCLEVDKNFSEKNEATFVSDMEEQCDTIRVDDSIADSMAARSGGVDSEGLANNMSLTDSVDVANSVCVANNLGVANNVGVANCMDVADSVGESTEVDCNGRRFNAAITSTYDQIDKANVNYDVLGVLEYDKDEPESSTDMVDETESISDDDIADILDADDKDGDGVSEKMTICRGENAESKMEEDFGCQSDVNDISQGENSEFVMEEDRVFHSDVNDCTGNGEEVPEHWSSDVVNSCLDEADLMDDEFTAVRESGRREIDLLKAAKLSLPTLYQLQIQAIEIQMKVAKLGVQIEMDKFKLDAGRRNYLLSLNVPENWYQVFSSRSHIARRYPGTSTCDIASSGSWSEEENTLSTCHTRNQPQDYLSRKMPKPKVPKSDKFIPKQDADGRDVGILRDCDCGGRQCADSGSSKGGRWNNPGDGNRGDKADKNRRNEKEQNSHHSNNNNDNNNNNNSNNPGQQAVGTRGVEVSLTGQQELHGRSLHDVQVPDNDYKAYRKKKHKPHDDYEWLEKLNNKLLDAGGPSFDLFAVLTNNEDVCLEVCLSRPGDISEDAMNCTMCLLIDSLLKHFTNCHSNFNSCDMCVRFFSLLCSHVTLCISRTGTVTECDIDICRTVIKMMPSTNLEAHVKTLWFQVRKKFARIIGIVEIEEQLVAEVPEKPVMRKPSLVRKPSGSGPLPSIPEMSVVPNTTFINSAVIRRRISEMRVHGESDLVDEEDVYIETVDAGATGNITQDDQAGSEASSISRPEMMAPDSDAIPTSSEEGSMEDSCGHSAVGKGYVSLPPAGPPCVGDTYFPSFQDRPRGIRGIGEVVYADRNQMLVVVTVWEKFKTQFQREAKLAKHYREEGVILSKYKNKLKINQLRYQTDFQWVKSAHLGNGMTGKCHLAIDFETEFKFCVKEIHISNYEKDEIELMSALDHEYIVQVYGAIRHAEKIYILQEFIEGGCLTEAINMQKKLGRRLSQLTALRYFKQLLKVLVYLKKHNILNEDIKADNILLDRNIEDASGPSSIKVTDFGMARRCQGSVPSGTKPVGTQTQWSPEKAEAVGYGYPAELWAAVCVLVHMLSGLPPWVRRFEEMKALILVIVDKSPPMEDIPRNILETIQDLIRRGFTVCQGQRPTAEELLSHPAFQLLVENSNPNGTGGIYSILESVHYQSHSIAEATNSIEDDPSADKRELHRKGLVDYKGASKLSVLNLGFEVPAQELSIYPAAPSHSNSGAASFVGNGANNGYDASMENTPVGSDIRYELLLLSQSQHEQANTSKTPVSAQPTQMVFNDPINFYLYDEFPINPNLPDLSIYEPNMIDDGREAEIGDSKPEQITEDDVTAILIPDFDKLLESGENSSVDKKTGDDWTHDPDEALAHVIRQYTSPGSGISPGSNHGDKAQAVSGGNIGASGGHADRSIVGGQVGQSGENEERAVHERRVGSSDEDEEVIESLPSNFNEDDLFSTGPTDNSAKKTKRKTQSDTDLWHLPKESKTRNQPQSAPPNLIRTDSRVSGSQPSSVNNQTPVPSHLFTGTGSHTMDTAGRPYTVGHPPYSIQYTHHAPTNLGPVGPHSMIPHGTQNFVTSTPVSYQQQMGARPKHSAHPRELFPVDYNTQRSNPTGPSGGYQYNNPLINTQPPASLDYPQQNPASYGTGNQHLPQQNPATYGEGNNHLPRLNPASYGAGNHHLPRHNPASYGAGNQYYYQSMNAAPPTTAAEQQYWGNSYRRTKIDQLQPKTPILNPVINPKAWPTQDGTRTPNLQLDIKKAREGTDSPISHVQTAPAFSPPKTPKKSPDFYRAQSEVPSASKKHTSVTTVLGSSPNDRLSTSTTRSQFEEQDALFKELGRTAEDALSQHSDPIHWQVYGFHEEECEDRNEFLGELENEVIDNPAQSCAHLFDDDDISVTITFRSDVNLNETRMKFTSKYFNQSWRNIIKEAMDGFSRHDMPREYGLTRFNLKVKGGDFIDLDHSLGNQSQILIMTEAMDNDPWWIERGMIY